MYISRCNRVPSQPPKWGKIIHKTLFSDNAHHNVYPYMETHNLKVNGAFTQMTHYTQCDVIFTLIDDRRTYMKIEEFVICKVFYLNG